MMMRQRVFAALCACFLASVASAAELIEQRGPLTVTIAGTSFKLDSFLARLEAGTNRLPIALIVPGGNRSTAPLDINPYTWLARDFARRGWLAAVVMRRGYGGSEGTRPSALPCTPGSVEAWATDAADELAASLQAVGRRPDADPGRMIVIGTGSGGLAAIALSARNPRGLDAVVSLAGGIQPENRCASDAGVAEAMKKFGLTSRVSNLWIYSPKDEVFPPDFTENLHAAFLDGGGDVKFVQFHIDGDVGNDLMVKARRPFLLQVDGFLRMRQLPTWTRTDVAAIVEKLGVPAAEKERAVRIYADQYFPAPGEKALAFYTQAQTGQPYKLLWGSGYNASSLEEARKIALTNCQKSAPAPCSIVMENYRFIPPGP